MSDTRATDGGGFLGRHGYRHDIFMSYSHGDVAGKGTSQLKQWSRQFCDLLGETLNSYCLHAPVSIFLDEGPSIANALDRAAPLSPELASRVARSALLLIAMTPQYLRSDWCGRELASWMASLPAKKGCSDRRIAVARVLDTAKAPWPPALCDDQGNQLVGWRFQASEEDFPFGWAKDWKGCLPDGMEKEFLKLASFLCRRLRELDEELERKAREAELVEVLEQGGLDHVYLYGREDESDAWASVYDDLDRLGVRVSPGEPEPLDADDDARKRDGYARLASQCEAMVMVGNDPIKLDYDLELIGHKRRQLIWSRYRKYLPCAVIDRTGSLSQGARIRNAQRRKIGWLRTSDCDWPDCVHTWLRASAQEVADRYGVLTP